MLNDLPYCEVERNLEPLRNQGDQARSLPAAHRRKRLSFQQDFSRSRDERSGSQAKQCRLACTVCPNQGCTSPLVNDKADVIEYMPFTVAEIDMVKFEEGVHKAY